MSSLQCTLYMLPLSYVLCLTCDKHISVEQSLAQQIVSMQQTGELL